MFEEHSLHAPIRNGADLGVIERIEVQQGKRFGLHNGVESVPLDSIFARAAVIAREAAKSNDPCHALTIERIH
jgi:hypothetical protein